MPRGGYRAGYRRPNKSWQARTPGGKFRRNVIEDIGLHVEVCPDPRCRLFQPWPVGGQKPTRCHTCGLPLAPPVPPAPFGAVWRRGLYQGFINPATMTWTETLECGHKIETGDQGALYPCLECGAGDSNLGGA